MKVWQAILVAIVGVAAALAVTLAAIETCFRLTEHYDGNAAPAVVFGTVLLFVLFLAALFVADAWDRNKR